jgi:hypothetical protein
VAIQQQEDAPEILPEEILSAQQLVPLQKGSEILSEILSDSEDLPPSRRI